MKNQMSYFSVAMLSIMTVVACGKKDENQVAATPAPAPAVTYVVQNGQCVQSGTTTVVAATNCPAIATSGYYVSGTLCLQTGTNIAIGPAPCPTNGWQQTGYQGNFPPGYLQFPTGYTPGVGGYVGANIQVGPIGISIGGLIGGSVNVRSDLICRGWFFQPGVGWGVCNGFNCRNMIMYNQYGPVYCP